MVDQGEWIEKRNQLASELRKDRTDDELRGELRDRWGMEAGTDEGDPALMLANVRMSEETTVAEGGYDEGASDEGER